VRYGFEKGVVVEVNSAVRLEGGEILYLKTGTNKDVLLCGDQVIVTWISPEAYPRNFRGKRYVDGEAVEKVACWQKKSLYVRKHHKDSGLEPFRAEKMVVDRLRSYGVRAEPATDFEDEMLGVDAWIFLRSSDHTWIWYPLDITLREDMSPHQNESKYGKAFQKGVIAVNVDFQLESNSEPVMTVSRVLASFQMALEDFHVCGRKLLTRNEAMRREVNNIR
jgi:hypothetical protein